MKKLGILLIVVLAVMPIACGAPATEPESANDVDVKVATQMAGLFYDLQSIGKYYDDGLVAMASVEGGPTALTWNNGVGESTALLTQPIVSIKNNLVSTELLTRYLLWDASLEHPGQQSVSNIPSEFLKPLPPDGAIAAPPGACPAAAKPIVTFKTAGGETVTPQLFDSKNLQTLPSEMLIMAQDEPGSLFSTINTMVPLGDRGLASPQGWNTMLWDRLKSLQVPAQSLMDYHLWNTSEELEQQIADLYLQRLQSVGVPPIVIEAFNNSNKTGWYTSTQPTPEDALAQMDILAEMTGSINGIVHEQRDFSIPGAGQKPIFGPQTGEGTVTWEHPDLGLMTFTVDILLDQFDEQGRAIGGTVVAEDAERGYTVRFIFESDGTKKGEVLKDGELVGLLTMTTNADKFENYVDVQTNQSLPLPVPY